MPNKEIAIDAVVIIESIPENEPQTGTLLMQFLRGLSDSIGGFPVEVRHYNVACAQDALSLLDGLTNGAREIGLRPMVHFECHGSEYRGLVFKDYSTISWEKLAGSFAALNLATGFNLIAVIAACFGGEFIIDMESTKPSPCYAIIGPSEETHPGELMQGYREFYGHFLRTFDAGAAAAKLHQVQLENGFWVCQTAESIFQTVLEMYCRRTFTKKFIKHRAMELLVGVRADGVGNITGTKRSGGKKTMRFLKKKLIEAHSTLLTGRYFDIHFMVDVIPENGERFAKFRKKLEAMVVRHRAAL